MGAEFYLHGLIDNFDDTVVVRARPQDILGIEIGDDLKITLTTENCFAFTK